MPWTDVFAPVESRYRSEIAKETWGHLAPEKNRTYRGHIIFAIGCFGSDELNPTALECEFGKLESSPWFFDSLMGFMQSFKTEIGSVYRWDGSVRNYTFKGVLKKMKISVG